MRRILAAQSDQGVKIMIRKPKLWFLGLLVMAAAAFAVLSRPSAGREKDSPSEPAEATAVRETNRAYAAAFAKGDAKAIAALWTENAEYDGLDAEPLRGRAAIEAAYAQFFKDNPAATLEAKVQSVRLLGAGAAVEEGSLQSKRSDKKEAGETRFSAFLVKEGTAWRFASVREWSAEVTDPVTLDDLAWLEGEWSAKGEQREIRLTYTRDDAKTFLHGKYTTSQDGKVVRSGTQIIGKDPNGGLRSWQFENDGGFAEWTWVREGGKWVIEGAGTLPDGSEQTASHLLVPVNKDNFTWQLLEHSSDGVSEPELPPVKVSRVAGAKR
jgi:uncharacterized protein (TIGR02246 family)